MVLCGIPLLTVPAILGDVQLPIPLLVVCIAGGCGLIGGGIKLAAVRALDRWGTLHIPTRWGVLILFAIASIPFVILAAAWLAQLLE